MCAVTLGVWEGRRLNAAFLKCMFPETRFLPQTPFTRLWAKSPQNIFGKHWTNQLPTSLPVVTSLQGFEKMWAYGLILKDCEHRSLPSGHRGGSLNPYTGMSCFKKVSRKRMNPEYLGPLMPQQMSSPHPLQKPQSHLCWLLSENWHLLPLVLAPHADPMS